MSNTNIIPILSTNTYIESIIPLNFHEFAYNTFAIYKNGKNGTKTTAVKYILTNDGTANNNVQFRNTSLIEDNNPVIITSNVSIIRVEPKIGNTDPTVSIPNATNYRPTGNYSFSVSANTSNVTDPALDSMTISGTVFEAFMLPIVVNSIRSQQDSTKYNHTFTLNPAETFNYSPYLKSYKILSIDSNIVLLNGATQLNVGDVILPSSVITSARKSNFDGIIKFSIMAIDIDTLPRPKTLTSVYLFDTTYLSQPLITYPLGYSIINGVATSNINGGSVKFTITPRVTLDQNLKFFWNVSIGSNIVNIQQGQSGSVYIPDGNGFILNISQNAYQFGSFSINYGLQYNGTIIAGTTGTVNLLHLQYLNTPNVLFTDGYSNVNGIYSFNETSATSTGSGKIHFSMNPIQNDNKLQFFWNLATGQNIVTIPQGINGSTNVNNLNEIILDVIGLQYKFGDYSINYGMQYDGAPIFGTTGTLNLKVLFVNNPPVAFNTRLYVQNKHGIILNSKNPTYAFGDVIVDGEPSYYKWYLPGSGPDNVLVNDVGGDSYVAVYWRNNDDISLQNKSDISRDSLINVTKYDYDVEDTNSSLNTGQLDISIATITTQLSGGAKDDSLRLEVNTNTYALLSTSEQQKTTIWFINDTLDDNLIRLNPLDGYYGNFSLSYRIIDSEKLTSNLANINVYVLPYSKCSVASVNTDSKYFKLGSGIIPVTITYKNAYDSTDYDFTALESSSKIKAFLQSQTALDIDYSRLSIGTAYLNGVAINPNPFMFTKNLVDVTNIYWTNISNATYNLTPLTAGQYLLNTSVPTNSLSFNGNMEIVTTNNIVVIYTNDTDFSNNLTVLNTTTTGELNVKGNSTILGNENISGSLSAESFTDLAGFNVSSGKISANNLMINGDTTSISFTDGKGFRVSNGIVTSNNIINSGDIKSTTLSTSSDAIINNNLSVVGNIIVGKAVAATTLTDGTFIATNGQVSSVNINNSSKITTLDLDVSSDINVTGNMIVNGSSNLIGNINTNGKITAGSITDGTFSVSNGTISSVNITNAGKLISETLEIASNATIDNNLSVQGNAAIVGSVIGKTLSDGVFSTNNGTVSSSYVNNTNKITTASLEVSGTTKLNVDVTVNGITNASTIISSDVISAKSFTDGIFNVSNGSVSSANINNNAKITTTNLETIKNAIVGADLSVSGSVTTQDLTANGTIKGTIITDGSFSVSNGYVLSSNLTNMGTLITSTLQANADATISGNANVNNNLNVNNQINANSYSDNSGFTLAGGLLTAKNVNITGSSGLNVTNGISSNSYSDGNGTTISGGNITTNNISTSVQVLSNSFSDGHGFSTALGNVTAKNLTANGSILAASYTDGNGFSTLSGSIIAKNATINGPNGLNVAHGINADNLTITEQIVGGSFTDSNGFSTSNGTLSANNILSSGRINAGSFSDGNGFTTSNGIMTAYGVISNSYNDNNGFNTSVGSVVAKNGTFNGPNGVNVLNNVNAGSFSDSNGFSVASGSMTCRNGAFTNNLNVANVLNAKSYSDGNGFNVTNGQINTTNIKSTGQSISNSFNDNLGFSTSNGSIIAKSANFSEIIASNKITALAYSDGSGFSTTDGNISAVNASINGETVSKTFTDNLGFSTTNGSVNAINGVYSSSMTIGGKATAQSYNDGAGFSTKAGSIIATNAIFNGTVNSSSTITANSYNDNNGFSTNAGSMVANSGSFNSNLNVENNLSAGSITSAGQISGQAFDDSNGFSVSNGLLTAQNVVINGPNGLNVSNGIITKSLNSNKLVSSSISDNSGFTASNGSIIAKDVTLNGPNGLNVMGAIVGSTISDSIFSSTNGNMVGKSLTLSDSIVGNSFADTNGFSISGGNLVANNGTLINLNVNGIITGKSFTDGNGFSIINSGISGNALSIMGPIYGSSFTDKNGFTISNGNLSANNGSFNNGLSVTNTLSAGFITDGTFITSKGNVSSVSINNTDKITTSTLEVIGNAIFDSKLTISGHDGLIVSNNITAGSLSDGVGFNATNGNITALSGKINNLTTNDIVTEQVLSNNFIDGSGTIITGGTINANGLRITGTINGGLFTDNNGFRVETGALFASSLNINTNKFTVSNTGDTTVGGSLSVANTITATSDIQTLGNLSANSLQLNTNAKVGSITQTNNNFALDSSGNVTTNGDLITNNVTANSNLTVEGTSLLHGNIISSGSVRASSLSDGTFNVSGGNMEINSVAINTALTFANFGIIKYIELTTDIDLAANNADSYPQSCILVIKNIGTNAINIMSAGNTTSISAGKSNVFQRITFTPPAWQSSTMEN